MGWPRTGDHLRRYRAILAASGYTEVLIAASSVEEARALAEAAKYELPYELVEHAVEDVFEDKGVDGEEGSPEEDGPFGGAQDDAQMAFEFLRTGVGNGEPSTG